MQQLPNVEVSKRVGPSWQGKGKHGGKAELQEAALIVLNVRPAMVITGKPPIRIAIAPFGCQDVVMRYRKRQDRSAGSSSYRSFLGTFPSTLPRNPAGRKVRSSPL